MAENEEIEVNEDEAIIPDLLEQILSFALDEAKTRLAGEGELAPFTAVLVRDKVYFDTITGESVDEMYEKAEELVKSMDGMSGYAFCYDGWVEDEDTDAIIAEGGLPGDPAGAAVCIPYEVIDEETLEFSEEALYLGDAPNYAETLGEPDEWDGEEDED